MNESDPNSEQLMAELFQRRRCEAARRLMSQRMRDEIWKMRNSEEIEPLLRVIYESRQALQISFEFCGVNIIDTSTTPPSITAHSMDPRGKWKQWKWQDASTVLRFWQGHDLVYRKDLAAEDPYGEHRQLPYIRSIVDVPFSHGTLAVSSTRPHAFADVDLEILQDMAALLSEGFRRKEDLQRLEQRNRELEQEITEREQRERQQLALHRVREQVWKMESADDILRVLTTLRTSLETLRIPFSECGINVIDASADSLRVRSHDMNREGRWAVEEEVRGKPVIVQMRDAGTPVYRRDLEQEDVYRERTRLAETYGRPIRSVLDVPFSHGTLAVNSVQPGAFSEWHISVLQELAQVLSEGFQRLEDLQTLEHRNRELAREIAERRQVQERLQQSLRDLEQTNQYLHEAQVRLIRSERMAALGDLVAGLAHELNTPVGALGSTCDTLVRAVERLKQTLVATFPREYEGNQPLRKTLGTMVDTTQVMSSAVERMITIVRSLRNFARLDEAEFKMVDLQEGIESALTLLQHQMGEEISLVRDYADLSPIYGSPSQLNQVFMHLLKNAIQAIGRKGVIRIRTFQDARQAHVQISDTGVGIPPERLERIFDLGLRKEGSRMAMKFGLSIDYSIVQEHRGTIQIESEVGSGTVVTVSLPRPE